MFPEKISSLCIIVLFYWQSVLFVRFPLKKNYFSKFLFLVNEKNLQNSAPCQLYSTQFCMSFVAIFYLFWTFLFVAFKLPRSFETSIVHDIIFCILNLIHIFSIYFVYSWWFHTLFIPFISHCLSVKCYLWRQPIAQQSKNRTFLRSQNGQKCWPPTFYTFFVWGPSAFIWN